MLDDMLPLLRQIAHATSLPNTPFLKSEASWAKEYQKFASLRSLLQINPGQVFLLDNPQTGFPVIPISLIASLLALISKDKVRQYLQGEITNA